MYKNLTALNKTFIQKLHVQIPITPKFMFRSPSSVDDDGDRIISDDAETNLLLLLFQI